MGALHTFAFTRRHFRCGGSTLSSRLARRRPVGAMCASVHPAGEKDLRDVRGDLPHQVRLGGRLVHFRTRRSWSGGPRSTWHCGYVPHRDWIGMERSRLSTDNAGFGNGANKKNALALNAALRVSGANRYSPLCLDEMRS